MKPYYIRDLYGQKRDFVDREEIRDLVLNEVSRSNSSSYFKVLEIYGFGGMGKTRLLEELDSIIRQTQPDRKVIRVSFEIYKNHQIVNNLSVIRKKLDFTCLFFDYALTTLWDRIGMYELCNDLLPKIHNEILTAFLDTISTYIPDNSIKIPSVENILKLMDVFLSKIQNLKHKNILQSIPRLSDIQIIERMPTYLGIDIIRHFDISNESIIFMFDAYIQSKPYSESNEWLLHLISHIRQGLFIITGREKLLWEDSEHDILPYELKKYPVTEARKYLQNYINDADIIETIINCTDCIPIYVDLAVDVYQREYNINPSNIIDKTLFSDRGNLVKHFINHLKPEWQECILYLSVIRVFNKAIYQQLIIDLHLPTSFADYTELTQISLAKYSEKSDHLFKIHDVFCNNASRILTSEVKLEIFHSYIKYFEYRGVYFDNNITESDVVVLFNNLLRLEIELSKENIISEHDIERTLNIFFVLQDMRMRFSVMQPKSAYSQRINDLLYFLNGILAKQDSTRESVALLEQVCSPSNFGKHIMSYNIVYKYNKSLMGQYSDLKHALYSYNDILSDADSSMWYYTRIKFYIADYQTMDGDFFDALTSLTTMKNNIPNDILNRDKLLHLYRYIGHIYRFNMFIDKAVSSYSELLNENDCSSNAKTYLNTNICEAICYTNPEKLFSIFEETLENAIKLGHTKNTGKLYYSRAIAYILKQEYEKAQADINNSLRINIDDGYDSGCLFAYMAQSYLDYALTGSIKTNTLNNIYSLLKNGVYEYFKLPIYIMQKKYENISQIKDNFDWLDFEYTLQQYNIFFSSINPNHDEF